MLNAEADARIHLFSTKLEIKETQSSLSKLYNFKFNHGTFCWKLSQFLRRHLKYEFLAMVCEAMDDVLSSSYWLYPYFVDLKDLVMVCTRVAEIERAQGWKSGWTLGEETCWEMIQVATQSFCQVSRGMECDEVWWETRIGGMESGIVCWQD